MFLSEWYVKPHKGVIRPNEHQIFLFRFAPKMNSYTVDKCEITLNYLEKHLLEVAVVGAGLTPNINLENRGCLYFSPTCKNNFSFQTYEIANLTRSKLCYEWKIPYETRHIFTVDEPNSCLLPYEIKKCVWRFAPDKIEKFNSKVNLVSWIEGEKANTSSCYSLRILGVCMIGSLQAAEMYKDFGSVVVGSSVTTEIIIINNNDCALDFELFIKQTSDEHVGSKATNDICVLEFESSIGHVEARSKHVVRCRLRPTRLINYQFTIEYKIIYPNDKSAVEQINSNQESPRNMREIFCYMTANGVYPKLKINDIKCLGAASSLSQDYFWKLLSINQ